MRPEFVYLDRRVPPIPLAPESEWARTDAEWPVVVRAHLDLDHARAVRQILAGMRRSPGLLRWQGGPRQNRGQHGRSRCCLDLWGGAGDPPHRPPGLLPGGPEEVHHLYQPPGTEFLSSRPRTMEGCAGGSWRGRWRAPIASAPLLRDSTCPRTPKCARTWHPS
eukprot:604523-Amphidinium_carterae.1